MKTLTSNLPTLPAYHQRMLLVKSSTETLPSALAEFKEHGLGQVTGLAQQMERAAAAGAFSASSGSSTFPPARQPDPNAGVFLIEFSDDKQLAERERQLASDTEIAKVSRFPIRYAVAGSNFPAFPNPNTRLWNLEKIGFYELNGPHDFTGDAHVALLDTGIDSGHPNLPRPAKYFYDHQILGSMSGQEDIHGHGTHVAGIVCAKESSTTSICGICKCQVSVWKIFNDVPELIKDVPEPYFTYVVDPAMYFRTLGDCLTSEIKIINLSIGGPTEPDFQEAELWQRLIGAGKVAVAAMGNTGDDVKQYPAAIPGVIAVGATDNDDQVASFSGRGDYICVCAPGTGIWSTSDLPRSR
jgi:subtilisin family serine protease